MSRLSQENITLVQKFSIRNIQGRGFACLTILIPSCILLCSKINYSGQKLIKSNNAYFTGTTLDVIKFPIFSPSSERLHLRYMRLKVDQKRLHDLQARKKVKLKEHGRTEHGILIGNNGY
jgi:hypothetical protein